MKHNSILSDWIQSFAANTLPVLSNPPAKDIWQALVDYLPEESVGISPEFDASELLEQALGISIVVEYGREKIGWTATSDGTIAAKMQQIYSDAAYSKARHALGIDSLWIFLPELEFLAHYQDEDLYEKAPDPVEVYDKFPELLSVKDRQECIVIQL